MDIPADWYPLSLKLLLGNFGLTMLVVAAFFMLLHRIVTRGRIADSEIVYRWLAVFSLGFTGFYTFAMHVFYPEVAAAAIGWESSPFQYEVGIADLALGMIGFLSFKATYGFRLATVIGNTFGYGVAQQGILIRLFLTRIILQEMRELGLVRFINTSLVDHVYSQIKNGKLVFYGSRYNC